MTILSIEGFTQGDPISMVLYRITLAPLSPMRKAGDQAKAACGNLQLCAGPKAGTEGATHTVGQRRLERVRSRRSKTEDEAATEAEEEEGGWVLAGT